MLDGYYLALERGYRQLYQAVIDNTAEPWTPAHRHAHPSAIDAALRTPAILALYGGALITFATIGV